MVWGAMSRTRTFPLVVIPTTLGGEGYAQIINDFVLQHRVRKATTRATKWEFPFTWQHDNAPCHTSRAAESTLQHHGLEVLPWPARSPDLNPIENLWAIVSQRVYDKSYSTPRQLLAAVKAEWDAIPSSICQRLVDGMGTRCDAVIDKKGYFTKW